ncbi:MAG: imelysin family protein [Bacteroidota bacterium]
MKFPFPKPSIALFGIAIGLLIWSISCNSGTDPEIPTEFDRAVMLQNIGENGLLPVHVDFMEKSKTLHTASRTFVQQASQASLEEVQQAWLACKKSFKRCEVYNINEVREVFIHNKIDKWPTKVQFLENNLQGIDELTEAFVENSGSTSKGLPAIEYFLFAEDALASFSTDSLASRRLTYLVALTENLQNRANELHQMWENNLAEFSTNTENFSKGSLNQLVNSQCAVLEKILTDKLGDPLGRDTGGDPQPDKVEAYLSQVSIDLIQENLISLKASFLGDDSKPGLGDLLDFLEAKQDDQLLSSIIIAQMDACIAQAALVPSPLQETVLTQPEVVDDLYERVLDLTGSIKVDMANQLGILITFKDTDGD